LFQFFASLLPRQVTAICERAVRGLGNCGTSELRNITSRDRLAPPWAQIIEERVHSLSQCVSQRTVSSTLRFNGRDNTGLDSPKHALGPPYLPLCFTRTRRSCQRAPAS
jgi:hypothetical protein